MTLDAYPRQAAVVRRLCRAARQDRLAHGYLFVGADGTGREDIARRLAQGLLCEHPREGLACGHCAPCRRAEGSTHPDLHVVMSEAEAVARGLAKAQGSRQPSRDIRIDAIRQVAQQLRMQSFEGRGRVGIVINAHRLRVEAANALLKTLEEPSPGTLLILLAPGPRSVLDTLRSRCQVVRFAPLEDREVAKVLVEQGQDAQQAAVLAARSDGSVARAALLSAEEFEQRHSRVRDFLQAVHQRRDDEIIDIAAEMGRDRGSARDDVNELIWQLRQGLRTQLEQGALWATPSLAAACSRALDAQRALWGNAVAQLTLEALALDLQKIFDADARVSRVLAGGDS